MNAVPAIAKNSSAIEELSGLFANLKKPYSLDEIVFFNLAYQSLYPHLSRADRLKAEELMDALLADMENKKLALKMYGVV